ncbi:fatty acid desaturase [Sulfobacillus thermosulfidooxidans]|uniref:fatty acid desaturase n=1 Tax=Sulfobacillus thermosulfidooxidans TaxID=28034 RepID=UPI0006B52A5E|nr:fatty acid desaturase [Sulfobacillus thermosulfidooxidans]
MTWKVDDPAIRQQLKSLMVPSTMKSVIVLVWDWIVIGGIGTVTWRIIRHAGWHIWSMLILCGALCAIATRQRGLENLIHEATHANLSARPWVNDSLAWVLACLPLGHNLTVERQNHVQGHHWHNFGVSTTRIFSGIRRLVPIGCRLPITVRYSA